MHVSPNPLLCPKTAGIASSNSITLHGWGVVRKNRGIVFTSFMLNLVNNKSRLAHLCANVGVLDLNLLLLVMWAALTSVFSASVGKSQIAELLQSQNYFLKRDPSFDMCLCCTSVSWWNLLRCTFAPSIVCLVNLIHVGILSLEATGTTTFSNVVFNVWRQWSILVNWYFSALYLKRRGWTSVCASWVFHSEFLQVSAELAGYTLPQPDCPCHLLFTSSF